MISMRGSSIFGPVSAVSNAAALNLFTASHVGTVLSALPSRRVSSLSVSRLPLRRRATSADNSALAPSVCVERQRRALRHGEGFINQANARGIGDQFAERDAPGGAAALAGTSAADTDVGVWSPSRRFALPRWQFGGGVGCAGVAAVEKGCQRAITAAFEGGTQVVNAKLRDVDAARCESTFTGCGGDLPDHDSGSCARPRSSAGRPALTCRGQHRNQLLLTVINARFCPRCADSGVTCSLHLRNIVATRRAQPAHLQHTATNARCGGKSVLNVACWLLQRRNSVQRDGRLRHAIAAARASGAIADGQFAGAFNRVEADPLPVHAGLVVERASSE